MAEELDETESLPSSEQATLDEAGQAPSGEPVGDAGASTATTGETTDTLSIIRDVVGGKDAVEAAGSQPEGEAEPDEGIQTKEPDDEGYTDVPFNSHPRFQHLLRRVKRAEEDAGRYRNVEQFLSTNGLAADEAADMLMLGAMLKHNPAAAWEKLKPWAEKAAIAAGAILPPDLQQRVSAGEITPQVAQELSRARGQQTSYEAQRQLEAQRSQQEQFARLDADLKGAAASWGQEREVRDPHFAAKMPALQREIAFLQTTEGKPRTPAAVREQCERAYAAVNQSFRAPTPAAQTPPKRPTRPVTGGQVAMKTPAPDFKSELDVVKYVVGKAGA